MISFPGMWSWLVTYSTVNFVDITGMIITLTVTYFEYSSSDSSVYTRITFKISSSISTCCLLLVAISTYLCSASSHVTSNLPAASFGHIILHFLL
jgi:hypothetical protein